MHSQENIFNYNEDEEYLNHNDTRTQIPSQTSPMIKENRM
jgi:hypothetical protein